MTTIISADRCPDKKFCIPCKKKIPPIETILKCGENIAEYRWNRRHWYCDDCYKKMQKEYRESYKGIWTTYEREKEEEELEQFEKEWNDPEFARVRELSDKVVKVWNKFGRRKPEFGLLKDLICSIIFKDDWNVSVDRVIDDLIKNRSDSTTIKNRHKEILYLYIPSVIDAFREEYRRKARNRWDGLIDSVNHKYAGREKLVAKPPHKDPKTKRYEQRWYLLSYEEELRQRNEMNKTKKERIDYNMDIEDEIVRKHEQRHTKEQFEDTKTNKESDKNTNDNNVKEGGE